ncbi:hypothetical protein RB601_002690 [Gaeumannomyces tritici]
MHANGLSLAAIALLLFPSFGAAAATTRPGNLHKSSVRQTDCRSASNRACWNTDGFDIHTDYYGKVPVTNVTRKYTLHLTEVDNYLGADGAIKEKAMLVNGQFPGPTLRTDWGDWFEVTVFNDLQLNGTGIHWHGLRQYLTNTNDGVPGVTECPIPPGQSKTYRFQASQYGTTWYHTHVSSQYAYGTTGSLVIDGPAAAPYDVDLGPFPISDWYYPSVDKLLARAMSSLDPFVPGQPASAPSSDNLLFNGTNVNPKGPGGKYARVMVTPGKTHRLRLINPSADNTFTMSISGHNMKVIQADFVPVQPFTTTSLFMGIGQRYDVVVEANQGGGSYWINATFSSVPTCGQSENPFPAAILTYEGSEPEALPAGPGTPPPDTFCADLADLQPVVAVDAAVADFGRDAAASALAVALDVDAESSRVFWTVNGSAIDVQWEKPVLQYVHEGNTGGLPRSQNVIQLPNKDHWTYWLITNPSPGPHPIHLHGHDFLMLGRSDAVANPLDASQRQIVYNPASDAGRLRGSNPVRRDSTVLPAWGWLALAFKTDNPGAWIMHCHIAFHASQGLSVDFLELADQIPGAMDLGAMGQNCDAWRSYAPKAPAKLDSGL